MRQALAEKDPKKQNDQINHAVKQLLQNPELIDMDAVVPDLCASDNYLKVVQLCLLKIEALQQPGPRPASQAGSFHSDPAGANPKVEECLAIITGLVAALNQSITEQMDRRSLSFPLLSDGRDSRAKKGSKDYWKKLIFGLLSKLESDSDVYQLKI